MGLRDLHNTVAFFLIFTNAIAGFWGILLDRRSIQSTRFFWVAIIAAKIIVFVKAIIGVAIQSKENVEPNDFHYLYGFSMIIAIALLYDDTFIVNVIIVLLTVAAAFMRVIVSMLL